MTPEEFLQKAEEIRSTGNAENIHIDADELVWALLEDLGYGEGIAVIREKSKLWWYA